MLNAQRKTILSNQSDRSVRPWCDLLKFIETTGRFRFYEG